MNIIKYSDIENRIVTIRGQKALLDSDVAELYGRDTKEINQATKNNPNKFPEGYILDVTDEEYKSLRSNFLTLENPGRGRHKKYLPKAFTRKGCYMLATILTGDKAIDTTIAIIETFDKLVELKETVVELSNAPDEFQQKELMQKGGDIIAELIGDDMKVSDTETTIELNFAVFKFKHTVKKKTV